MKTAGIYIHIPFCNNKCIYCDYYSIEKQEKDIPRFVEMLQREIELTAKDHDNNWIFDTIYFGGGSPSLLSINDINKILYKLYLNFNISKHIELTLEMNPGEKSKEELSLLKESGVNRLSIGFQSLDLKLLQVLSRTHNPNDCTKTFENARVAGFENISIDLLYNIPGQTIERWLDDLETLIQLNCEHIAIFPLKSEKDTPFYKQVQSGEIQLPNSYSEEEMFKRGSKFLTDNGFIQYEVAHFAKSGKECKHNLHYWNLDPYLTFGPSAHGYDGSMRWWNVSSLDDYLNKLSNNERPIADSEILSHSDRFNEAVIYGLRTNEGISREILKNIDPNTSIFSKLQKWESHLEISEKMIRIKPGHYHLADEISTEILISDY